MRQPQIDMFGDCIERSAVQYNDYGLVVEQAIHATRKMSEHETLTVEVRLDDSCGNGHETFSVTAERRDTRVPERDNPVAAGCRHEEVTAVFPELKRLLKWHLTSTDGPMHYIANTVYHAGKRDFAAARACAVWPEATDEHLSAPKEELTALLNARLPATLDEFRRDMDSIGFVFRGHGHA